VRDKVVDWAPADWGDAWTVTVHEALPARVAVPQVSPTIVKSVEFESTGAEQPEAVLFPEFVSVNILEAEFDPTFTDPNLFVKKSNPRFTCWPETTIWFAVVVMVPPNEQTRESVVDFAPIEAGFARTFTVHVVPEPARSATPQLSLWIEKSVEFERVGAEQPVAEAAPELVRTKA
jgi:hypothetical protein